MKFEQDSCTYTLLVGQFLDHAVLRRSNHRLHLH